MDVTDRFFRGGAVTHKTTGYDLETAMAELLELRARVEEAAKFTGMPSCKRKSSCATDKRKAAGRRSDKPHKRTR